ncbi:MAG TPA: multidrug efflux SMR transporter [Candidatus Pelagibacter sp.]|jgi:small multidrug resistance pump|nr:multidrug efflux SMR transporter [Candidatus Pelagibacter sp.]
MNISNPYIFLFLAIIFGTASNSFAKSAEGFTQWIPSIASAITIILCMYALSNVMKVIPIGVTYASFAGLCIVATAVVGIIKFNQSPNFYTTVGLILIIVGVAMVNLLGKTGS